MQRLERRYGDQLQGDAKDFISFAVDGAKRMQALINDLLAYSRVGTKGKPFELISLDEVAEKAINNLKIAIEENHATISVHQLPTIYGDSTQLIQLFQNLIANAIKFHAERSPEIIIREERYDGVWRVSVADNGIGIDPQYAERIFLIFQRLHTREEYSGTGIGLAICKRIIERHGGRIWVDSTPGKGSTFYFTFPIEAGVVV
jgi:light-regulated signal transduction histidine kinase (bacteriophytochrome)